MEFNATFLISAISFIVFVFIMNAIFYNPLEKIVKERKKFIDENYAEAEIHKTKAAALLKDKEEKLSNAATDAKKIMLDKTTESKVQKDSMTDGTRQKASEEITQAKDELLQSTHDAKNVLKSQIVSLAQSISTKILGEDTNIENIDNELIEKIMQEG